MSKYLCALLAMLALTTTAGCGGPSREDYADDLNKVCKRSDERIRAVKMPRTIKEIASVARRARLIAKHRIKEAKDLELPDDQRERFQDYNDDFEKSLGGLRELEKAAAREDRAAVQRVFATTIEENRQLDVKARRLGLTECLTR